MQRAVPATRRMTGSPDYVKPAEESVWRRIGAWISPPPIASADALRKFLEERASLIAQKCAIDYCRGKTGLASYALFTEKPFLDRLDICRWEAFAAVLGDLCLVAEGRLRSHAAPEGRAALSESMLELYTAILTALPKPAHRPHGWDDAVASFAMRIRAAAAAAPKTTLDVADHSARRMFENLPIHSKMRELDEEVVYGAIRFRMIAVSQEMQRRFDGASIARALIER
jgi:hypothetical protein